MSALIKSSILLILAITIGVYLYKLSGGEDFDAVRPDPHEEICKRDGDRLARLQAKPSSDEAVRFGSELRCLKLWPQLLAILDSLSHTAGSVGVSSANGAALDTMSAGDASSSPAMEAKPATSLERHRDSTSPGQANPPASPQPAIPAKRSDLEPSPASASLPDGMPARVLIRYLRNNADARRRAESLANALTGQGVEVADLRESVGAIRTELSFSYTPDEAIALRVGRLAGIVPVRRPQPKDGLMARPGTVELSLSSDSHLAVITTSRKGSNHE